MAQEISRERIGDMLLAAAIVTQARLDEALIAQRKSGLRIGKQLVELGYVSEVQLTQTLSNQLSVPWVALDRVEFSAELLAKVPGELAERFTVMPIYVRYVRDQGQTLYIAMDDPTNEDAIRLVATAAQLPVRPMIASLSELRKAVEAHYFGGEDAVVAQPDVSPQPESPVAPAPAGAAALPEAPSRAVTLASQELARGARVKLPPPPPPTPARTGRADGAVPLELYEAPSQPPEGSKQAPARTLMLLDGTTIALPVQGRAPAQAEVSQVRHVVKAVRTACADLGIEQNPRWHDIVQALVDALRERGVKLTRREVAEAWAKRHATQLPKT